jgi:hypothetical protein
MRENGKQRFNPFVAFFFWNPSHRKKVVTALPSAATAHWQAQREAHRPSQISNRGPCSPLRKVISSTPQSA